MNSSPEDVKEIAKQAVEHGDLLKALDLASRGLVHHPGDLELLHTKALATLQIQGAEAAVAVLDSAESDISENVELLCLKGRIYKDAWADSGEAGLIQKAARLYSQASDLEPENEFPAINAATCWMLAGDQDQAFARAEQAKTVCDHKTSTDPTDFYAKITRAEAFAILGKTEQSQTHYATTAANHPHRIRDLASANKQARLIALAKHGNSNLFDDSFPRRRVLVMDHELIRDTKGRFDTPPANELEAIEARIEARLSETPCTIGFACPTSITELLFIEAVRQKGMSYHLVLPWSEQDLLDKVVPAAYHRRFRDILCHAESVRALSQANSATSEVSSHYSEMVMIGVATLLSQALDLELEFLILNGKDGPLRECVPAGEQTIKSILFADITSYSSLEEPAIPSFVNHFMRSVAELIENSEHRVLVSNTWGDALYLVFEDPESAGQFALELESLTNNTDWLSKGLPNSFGIRVGMHAGPVYPIVDPVIKRPSFTGFHVSWAARIEPRAAPNNIYTSEEFAALAAINQESTLQCDYVGLMPLSKNFGEKRLYRLRARKN